MHKPFLNALIATLYIMLVASLMYYAPKYIEPVDSVIVPIAMISLFTLSAAIMGYLFLYNPLQLYLDGQKKQATGLFLNTLFIFAGITVLIFIILFFTALF